MLLNGSECCIIRKNEERKIEVAQIRCLSAAGYVLLDKKTNDDIGIFKLTEKIA